MKVIAQRGPNYLLVETRTVEGQRWGRIWNVRRREMSPEQLVDAIAKFGYWTDYTGSQAVLNDLSGVRMLEARNGSPQAQGRRR